jgi:hypothetical protein
MNHSTCSPEKTAALEEISQRGPQRGLDIIREKLFDGWPQHCRLLEARTYRPRGKKRDAKQSGIMRIA